jgi:predicted RNase H-like HicB family nuclease
MKQFATVIEKGDDETTWGAYVPALPGCKAVGDSSDEVENNIKSAIEIHLELMQESGQTIPDTISKVTIIEVAA